ncbi:DUF2058 domain-containing protein, partial [bacterium]|nr:DUF2058 domain-containing protein [bacterium]
MSLSLRDQLVQAGLATKEQAQKSKKNKGGGKASKKTRAAKAQRPAKVIDPAKQEADRAKNAALEAKRQARAANKALDQMIAAHKIGIDEAKADQQFHFTIHGRFRPANVTAEHRKGLASGKLGIVVHRERTYIVLSLLPT